MASPGRASCWGLGGRTVLTPHHFLSYLALEFEQSKKNLAISRLNWRKQIEVYGSRTCSDATVEAIGMLRGAAHVPHMSFSMSRLQLKRDASLRLQKGGSGGSTQKDRKDPGHWGVSQAR